MAHSCIITEKQTKQEYQKHRISGNLSKAKTQTHAAGKATLQHAGVSQGNLHKSINLF